MAETISVLQKNIESMATIINALPGEAFIIKDSEILLIVQRRLSECELKEALVNYNEIFSKGNNVVLEDIVKSAVEFFRIRILVENNQENLDPYSIRELIKVYKAQITKVGNIMHLTKVNGMTASSFEKERIDIVLQKNQALLSGFEDRIGLLEMRTERMPKPEVEIVEEQKAPVKEESVPKKSLFDGMLKAIDRRKAEKDASERLKNEEKKSSRTSCVEIPYYDRNLAFTSVIQCKDIPAYVILKKKNNIYFGLNKNVKKGVYDNLDQSLIELTEATDEMLQFMSDDLLADEFELRPFSDKEKDGMKMYFNFISNCFEKYIGTTLTVMEYMKFKEYYNKLVLKLFSLEEKEKNQYYKALTLADKYIAFMQLYNLAISDEKELIIANILKKNVTDYVDDLGLIMEHHMVDENAKKDILKLIASIKDMNLDEQKQTVIESDKDIFSKLEVDLQSEDLNDDVVVTSADISNVQIKVQVLNSEKTVIDDAIFASSNISRAVCDYLGRTGSVKKIGVCLNGKDVFLFASKNGMLSVPILDKKIRKEKRLDQGVQGELIEFYEERIKKIMIEIVE